MKNLLSAILTCFILFACSELSPDLYLDSTIQENSSSIISEEEAIRIASNFSINSSKSRSETEISDVFVITNDINTRSRAEDLRNKLNDTLLYVVNYAKNNGFSIIIANRNEKSPVLAHSKHGYYNPSSAQLMPPSFLRYIDMAKYGLIQNGLLDTFSYVKEIVEKPYLPWDGVDRYDTIRVSSLLYTKWSQNAPYNQFAPNKVVGCGPTAIAQCLAYYMVPIQFSYTDDFTNESYDVTVNWPQIKNDCVNNKGQLDLSKHPNSSLSIAHLVRHISIDVNATYNQTSTSTNSEKLLNWVKNNTILKASSLKEFDYNSVRNAIYEKDIVYSDGFGDHDSKIVGHGWVFDGYITINKNGNRFESYLHCNWGWGGMCDGYYKCSVFNLREGPAFTDSSDGGESRDLILKYNLRFSTLSRN